ncbi:hypothetical protein [uncultured Cytophaga sp.]|uniref:hypothetical protein n=1 Tax=uncultured Cytophaga sp. TaxID=160238 RepID=UPI00262221A5|nr:hypothetical protein [uncultured Cytophaga sp.]
MYNIKIKYAVTDIQLLFIEKSIELLYKNTIDTFRLRLNNPKTVIKELMEICSLMERKELTNNEYAISLSKEVVRLLIQENELNFQKVNKKYYLNLLNTPKEYVKILQASRIVLSENDNYLKVLFEKIDNLINQYPDCVIEDSVIYNFMDLIQYLFIELLNLGYSKQYLHKFTTSIFYFGEENFLARYEILEKLAQREEEDFELIFCVENNKGFNISDLTIVNPNISIINAGDRKRIRNISNSKVADYLDKRASIGAGALFSIKQKALDYYKAVNISIDILSSDFDVYHLGHSDAEFKLQKEVVVIGSKNPQKATIIPCDYQIDGYYRSSKKVFDMFIQRLNKLTELKVSEESKRKIKSAIRYLRLGTESPQLENKLLNYWIGIEYIFTNHIDGSSTLIRIKDIFPKCHSIIYFKRNMFQFHKELDMLNEKEYIVEYNKNLEYLSKQDTYQLIIGKTDSVLMRYRAKYYLQFLQHPEKINTILNTHQENLKQNIIRLYRIRNEIVHNAAIKSGIAVHASHLRYYLTFILNSILEYFVNNPVDVDYDDKLTIEDFFISQDIMLGSIDIKGKIKIDKLLNVANPLELLN